MIMEEKKKKQHKIGVIVSVIVICFVVAVLLWAVQHSAELKGILNEGSWDFPGKTVVNQTVFSKCFIEFYNPAEKGISLAVYNVSEDGVYGSCDTVHDMCLDYQNKERVLMDTSQEYYQRMFADFGCKWYEDSKTCECWAEGR